jgi:GNAT superfamily N-acetyltransferase
MLAPDKDPRRPGTLWLRNLDWPTPDDVSPRIPTIFTRVGPEAAQQLGRLMGDQDPDRALRRFTPNRRCYAAWVEGALAACGWLSFEAEEIGELNIQIRPGPGEAYIWDCVTAPVFRRLRLYSALLAHISAELRGEGLCRVWIAAELNNLPSQRGILRAGFQPVADLVVARVIAMRMLWVRAHPGAPEQWVTDARRAVLGDRDRAWLAALPHRNPASNRHDL